MSWYGLFCLCLLSTVRLSVAAAIKGSISCTGTISNTKTRVTSLSCPSPVQVDSFVKGTGIPFGTTVTAINGTRLTLSLAATSNATATLTFAPQTSFLNLFGIFNLRPATVSCTGTTSSSVTVTISILSCASSIPVNSFVQGTGIAAGTTVTAITGKTLTLSQAASSSNAGVTLNFAPPATSSGDSPVYSDGEQQLQAFLKAIKDINDDTSLLPNYNLQFKIGDSASSFFSACSRAMTPAKQVTNYPYYRALVTSVGDAHIEAISTMLNEGDQFKELFYVVTNARTTSLSKGREHPFKGRLIPAISHSGDVFSSVVGGRFKFKRVAVFSTVDYFAAISLESFLVANNFQVLSKQTVQSGAHQDFSAEIREVKNSGARIIMVFADAGTTAAIIGQGWAGGIIQEGSLVFIHEVATTAATIDAIKLSYPKVDLNRLSRTVLGLQHDSRYGIKSTTKGSEFLTKWTGQAPTESPTLLPTLLRTFVPGSATPTPAYSVPTAPSFCPTSSGTWNSPSVPTSTLPPTKCGCDFETVPTSSPTLNPAYSVSTPTPVFYSSSPVMTCAGIPDFTAFTAETIDPGVPYVYDSVYAVARALHYLLETQHLTPNDTYPSANDMMDTFINHVSFPGVSGNVSFSKGLYRADGQPTVDLIGKGDRLAGHVFNLVKFSPDASSAAPWVSVGTWGGDSIWKFCDENELHEAVGVVSASSPCTEKFVYSTSNGLRPRDRPDDVHLEMVAGLVGFLIFLGAAGLLIVIILSVYLLLHRKNKLLKTAQPPMLAMVLLGQALAAIRVIVGTQKPTASLCHANLWIGHVAFVLVYGGLCLKMWRVDKIVNIRSIKRVKITDRDMMLYGFGLFLAVVVLLIIVSVHGKPHVELSVETFANVDTYINECRQDVPEVEQAMYAIEAVFLLWGIRLCNATKDAPSSVNESVVISAAATIIIVLAGAIIPVAYLANLDPMSVNVLAAFGFGVGQVVTTLVIFLPKALAIYRGVFPNFAKPGTGPAASTPSKSEAGADSSSAGKSRLENNTDSLQMACAKALHGIGIDDKFVMAHSQIAYWRRILMLAEENYNSQGQTIKNSSVASTAETDDGSDEKSFDRYQVSTEVENDGTFTDTAAEAT